VQQSLEINSMLNPSGCPFLAAVAAREGSVSPEGIVKAAAGLSRRVCGNAVPLNFDDDLSSIMGCFRLFHGSAGPIPLGKSCLALWAARLAVRVLIC